MAARISLRSAARAGLPVARPAFSSVFIRSVVTQQQIQAAKANAYKDKPINERFQALDKLVEDMKWADLHSSLQTPEAKLEMDALRNRFESVYNQLQWLRTPVAEPDFASWKKQIKTPGVAEALEKSYKSVVAQIDSYKPSAAWEATQKETEDKLLALCNEAATKQAVAEKRVALLEQEIETLASAKPLDDTSLDEELAKYPEATESIEKEIAENDWRVG